MKLSEFINITPLHRSPVDEVLRTGEESRAIPDSSILTFKEIERSNTEVAEYRRRITLAANKSDEDEKRQELLKIKKDIVERLGVLSDEINAKLDEANPELYADLHFLLKLYLDPNLPEEKTTKESPEKKKSQVEIWKSEPDQLPEQFKALFIALKAIVELEKREPESVATHALSTMNKLKEYVKAARDVVETLKSVPSEPDWSAVSERVKQVQYLQRFIENIGSDLENILFQSWQKHLDLVFPELNQLIEVGKAKTDSVRDKLDLIGSIENNLEAVKEASVFQDEISKYRKFKEYVDKRLAEAAKKKNELHTEVIRQISGDLNKQAWYQKYLDYLSINSLSGALTEAELEEMKTQLEDIPNSWKLYFDKLPSSELIQEHFVYSDNISRLLTIVNERLTELRTPKLDKNTAEIRQWIENLIKERFGPERKPGESIEQYLGRVHTWVLEIATSTVFNGIYDKSDNPHTPDYRELPTQGPLRALELLDHPQVYNQSDENRVKNLGAFCDQIAALFDDPEEKKIASEYGERLKGVLREIGIWHNRSVIINSNFDATGPSGSLKAYQEIRAKGLDPKLQPLFDREHMVDAELRFSRAVEFCMAVWSAKALSWTELEDFRKRKLISDRVFWYATNPDFNVVPSYLGSKDKGVALVERMIADCQAMGLSKKEAELAYHLGESFRIGSQLQPLYDVTLKEDKREGRMRAKVYAQEGTSKVLNIGPYVEGVPLTEARPSFNQVFAEKLVHGYVPWAVAAQYSYDKKGFPRDISGYNDSRATILQILACKGAVDHVDWSTRSSQPDKTVEDGAVQAINFLWSRAAIKSVKENPILLNLNEIPLSTTTILDHPEEITRLQNYFGLAGSTVRSITRFVVQNPLSFNLQIPEKEALGFDADSDAVSGARAESIKSLLKDARDYWIGAFTKDLESANSGDFLRMVEFLFRRNEEGNEFVNERIQNYITLCRDEFKAASSDEERENVSKKMRTILTGYMTYDVLLESMFYLMTPDFKSVGLTEFDPNNPNDLESAYSSIGADNWEKFNIMTIGGYRLPQIAVVMWLINQSLEIRDLLPDEHQKLVKAGYNLRAENDKGLIYTRADLLKILQSRGLAEGYEITTAQTTTGRRFYPLRRIKGHPMTKQYLIDRITLMKLLFRKNELNLQGGKK